METNGLERKYNIKNDGLYFHAGNMINGHQALMGLQLPELVLVEFDVDGNLLHTTVRHIQTNTGSGDHRQGDLANDQILEEISRWQDELAFTPQTIAVLAFFLQDRWIGIKDLPEHYQQVLDSPEQYSVERRLQLQEDIRLWRERGDFVLYWDEEYYLNRDGDVEST